MNRKEGEIMLEGSTLGERLYDLRKEHGYKNAETLAKEVNIPKSTLNHYENDEKNQSISYVNLVTLAKFYGVTTDYLLGATTCDKQSRSEIVDLNLTDETISVLKSNKLNHRLLCELLVHDKFPVFMRNIEIFVDNLASNRIADMNFDLVVLHQQISKQDLPPEEEKHLSTLEAGKIQADRYFKSVLYEDLDCILSMIRENHERNKKDPYSYLKKADIAVKVRELMKSLKQLDYARKRTLINQMNELSNELIKNTGIDISNENTEEKALRWILSLEGHTPEELSPEDREIALKLLKKDNKVWGLEKKSK